MAFTKENITRRAIFSPGLVVIALMLSELWGTGKESALSRQVIQFGYDFLIEGVRKKTF